MNAPTPSPGQAAKLLENWLRRDIQGVRRPLTATVALGGIGGALLIPQAWLLASIINAVAILGRPLNQLWPWLFGLVGIYVIRAALMAASELTAFETAARVRLDIRKQLVDQVHALGPAWARGQRSGELANTIIDGVEALEKYYAGYLPQTALAAFIPLAILVFVFPADWLSGIVMLVTAPLIPFFMVLIGKGAESLNQQQWRRLTRMSAHFLDVIEGLTSLKLFNASRREAEMIARISDDYRRATMRVLRVAFLSSLALEFLATVSIAMIAVFIGFRLMYGEIHYLPGLFVLLLAPEFYLPLRNMGAQYHARMEAIGASEQIVVLMDTPVRKRPPATQVLAANAPLRVQIENLGFAYEDGTPVVQQFNLTIEAGEHVALVGPSGAGKTTIARLVLGFLSPQSGRILVNGVDMTALDATDWMSRVVWLPQRPTLFHGSVLDNIRLARTDLDLDAVRQAARMAHADDFIQRLPNGYETLLGDRGQGLSGGQIQRIALARAFLKRADLIVLDEAAAGLDAETEALISDSIGRLARGKTLVAIAHRLDTVRKADRIVVLDKGSIVEQGPHAKLLESNGLYAAMNEIYHRIQQEPVA